jgi:hypothetical protein
MSLLAQREFKSLHTIDALERLTFLSGLRLRRAGRYYRQTKPCSAIVS